MCVYKRRYSVIKPSLTKQFLTLFIINFRKDPGLIVKIRELFFGQDVGSNHLGEAKQHEYRHVIKQAFKKDSVFPLKDLNRASTTLNVCRNP